MPAKTSILAKEKKMRKGRVTGIIVDTVAGVSNMTKNSKGWADMEAELHLEGPYILCSRFQTWPHRHEGINRDL